MAANNISIIIKKASMMIFTIMLASACYQPIPIEKPILSKAKLQVVLKDVHLAEALLANIKNRRKKDSTARVYYGQIFRIHKIEPADFEQSMNALFTTPSELDTLYTKVIKDLAKERKKRKPKGKKKKKPKKKKAPSKDKKKG